MNAPLRIGFIINEKHELPAWEYAMLSEIEKSDYAVVPVFIVSRNRKAAPTSFGLRLFQWFERKWFGKKDDAYAVKPVPVSTSTVFLDSGNREAIAACNLDIVYCSCTVFYPDELLTVIKGGIWKIVFGTGKYKNGSPAGFWEVMNDEPVTGVSLQVHLSGGNDFVTVYNGITASVPYSVKNNLNCSSWKASSFFSARLREYYETGSELFFEKHRKTIADNVNNESLNRTPGSIKTVFLFVRNIGRYLQYKIRQQFKKGKFQILVVEQEMDVSNINLSQFQPLSLPNHVFQADPFIVKEDGKQYIFFEEYDYHLQRGHISVIESEKQYQFSTAVKVLEKPYHLSYPFVFKHENMYYMIPETGENRTVELYRATHFPQQWEFVMCLMKDILLLDATLLFLDNKWWLFGCSHSHPATSTNDQLYLFYADDLFTTNWKAHPQNPIVTDIGNCRPAGSIFFKEGHWYRPAQNNASKQYGYGIKINRIDVLNEKEYQETVVSSVSPDTCKDFLAVHTINFTDNLIVIDGITKR
jgi:hypothetical protein